jgi:mono/diheme cytochrome c family protein
MTPRGSVAILAAALAVSATAIAQSQRNGEATSSVPVVERERYDMRTFMTPLALSEAERNGRRLVAQRCANCHGGNSRQPGPLLSKSIVENRGETFIREKVKKGSMLMPGFEWTLQAGQVDDIIAFLKTYTPPARAQGAADETP